MSGSFPDFDLDTPKRPVFLTVLCILTFIGSGWGLISGGIQYFSAEKQVENFVAQKEKATKEIARSSGDDKDARMGQKMVESMQGVLTVENIRKTGVVAVFSALFCLAGALLMWNLNKTGFYLYIVGVAIMVVGPIMIYGTNNFISMISGVFYGVVGIAFIIMYGLNVKYMK